MNTYDTVAEAVGEGLSACCRPYGLADISRLSPERRTLDSKWCAARQPLASAFHRIGGDRAS